MPRKELSLLAQDLYFYATGMADVAKAPWEANGDLYPLDWSYQIDRPEEYFSPMDAAGVPMRQLPGGLGLTYLPSRIAGYGCGYWNRWVQASADADARRKFFIAADWFASQNSGLFQNRFDLIGLKSPWLSCVSQGEGISVLIRAFKASGQDRYAEVATMAVEPMLRPLRQGGLLDTLHDGSLFLEEYPGTQYAHVLNGCFYGLVGLHDYVTAGLDVSGKGAGTRDAVLDGIEANIAAWERGNWTVYDFQRGPHRSGPANLNTLTYQTLQWVLAEYLGKSLARTGLIEAAARWRSGADSITARARALAGKLYYRIVHGYRK